MSQQEADSELRLRGARWGATICYILLFNGCFSWVSLGTLGSSMLWGCSQSLQQKQRIFEARFLWAAVEGKRIRAMGLGIQIQHAHWRCTVVGVDWTSLSQVTVFLPFSKSPVVPHDQKIQDGDSCLSWVVLKPFFFGYFVPKKFLTHGKELKSFSAEMLC